MALPIDAALHVTLDKNRYTLQASGPDWKRALSEWGFAWQDYCMEREENERKLATKEKLLQYKYTVNRYQPTQREKYLLEERRINVEFNKEKQKKRRRRKNSKQAKRQRIKQKKKANQ